MNRSICYRNQILAEGRVLVRELRINHYRLPFVIAYLVSSIYFGLEMARGTI